MRRIKVSIQKAWTGKYYTIHAPEIDYETFLSIGDNLSIDAINYGKRKYSRVYPKEIEEMSNDVSYSHYDYDTNSGTFTASTETDVKNWLKLYEDIITT